MLLRRKLLHFPILLIFCSAFDGSEQATVVATIKSEEIRNGSLGKNETACFVYQMAEETTKDVVYWDRARLLVKLDPCSGTPHLKVSVYGCPSEGHHVNWEFQSELARNDLRARGAPVPAPWEWPGDIEILTIEVTHRRFYVEVSRYHSPIVSIHDLRDLSTDLRNRGKLVEAEDVASMMTTNFTTTEQQARLTQYQDDLLPDAGFELSVTLHNAVATPREKLYPMTYAASWDKVVVEQVQIARGLRFSDDATASFYNILFWPPTRSVNDSLANLTGTGLLVANLTNLRRSGDDVAGQPRQAGSHVGGHVASKGAAERARQREEWMMELRATEELLEGLERRGIPEVNRKLAEAAERESHGRGGSRRAAVDGIGSRYLPLTATERAALPLKDADLRFQVYWTEVTGQFQQVWGTVLDSSGTNRTRLIDRACARGPEMGQPGAGCGIRQIIGRTQFEKMDDNGDGLLSRAEYYDEYPPELEATAFGAGETFETVAGPAGLLAEWQWLEAYATADDILREELKDPKIRTFWTPCGMRDTGTLLAPSGNASEQGNPDHWFGVKDFQQLEDGRLGLAISGLNDDNNNVYMFNILVRNNATGEEAAYAVHTVQRRTPLYTPPEVGGSEIGLVVGVSVSAAVAVVVLAVAVVMTRSTKMRPRLRVRKKD